MNDRLTRPHLLKNEPSHGPQAVARRGAMPLDLAAGLNGLAAFCLLGRRAFLDYLTLAKVSRARLAAAS